MDFSVAPSSHNGKSWKSYFFLHALVVFLPWFTAALLPSHLQQHLVKPESLVTFSAFDLKSSKCVYNATLFYDMKEKSYKVWCHPQQAIIIAENAAGYQKVRKMIAWTSSASSVACTSFSKPSVCFLFYSQGADRLLSKLCFTCFNATLWWWICPFSLRSPLTQSNTVLVRRK